MKFKFIYQRTVNLLVGVVISLFTILSMGEAIAQPFNAQSDLFNVLQNTCGNYLDASANDNLDSTASFQLQVISLPANGSASPNGKYLTYCPDPGFMGADQFQYSIGDSVRMDTATVYINVLPPNNQVNRGDADQNGKVESFDVLTLGLAYGALGPARLDSVSNASLAWSPLSYINTDPGAADCNGNGIVDSNDVGVIQTEFGNTFSVLKPYEVDTSVCDAGGVPFYIESLSGDSVMDGESLVISISLADSNNATEAYGIAFTIEFDNRFISGSQVQWQTSNAWLLQNDNGIFFKKDFQSTGTIDVAITKTNHNPALGGGEIMYGIFPIDDNIDGIAVGPGWHDLKLNLVKVRLISEYDIVRDVCVAQTAIKVHKVATGIEPVQTNVQVLPNPSNGRIIIIGNDLREIKIADLTGKVVFNSVAGGNRIEISTSLSPGVYVISIKTGHSVITKKLFVQP